MRKYVLGTGATSLDCLRIEECATPRPGAGEVLVRMRACSLNYRDQMIVQGKNITGPVPMDITPLSDGAGEIVEVGAGVSAFKTGDRVVSAFFPNWVSGPPRPDLGSPYGEPGAPGMLAEYVVLPETGIAKMASHLSFEEASTLSCAGLTAWNAVMDCRRPLRPGDSVLVLGTGGVSILALQIAHAAGARVIVTSSSDEKLERARSLGAAATINYKTTPEWGAVAASLSGKNGVDCVVEVGGPGTMTQSMEAVGIQGEIALVGILAMDSPGPQLLLPLALKNASIRGVFCGSRSDLEDLNRALEANGVKPAIDRVFPFEEAVAAFNCQARGAFSKVVIAV